MVVPDVRGGLVTSEARSTFTRRQALAGGTAILASAALPLTGGQPAAAGARRWGRIANGPHRAERIFSGLFFAGPPNPASLPLYTHHPLDAERLDWSRPADIEFALRQFASAGLNTIKLSYFGHEGETDQFAPAWLFSRQRWPGDGDGTYTETEQVVRGRQLFRAAARHKLLVAPMLEVSPAFRFWADFPHNLDGLVGRSAWLLRHFGHEPSYLRVYDRDGLPRHVVWLIESIHVGPVDPRDFAAGFDRAAQLLHDQLGYRVGFIIDPTPLPAYGTHDGPDPAALRETSSILAVNPFNITSQGPGDPKPQDQITDHERISYARGIMTTWSNSGLPFLAPVLPGYDAHIVFPGTGVYGFHPQWLIQQQRLAAEFATDGLTVDTWNGWTEGYAIPPSQQDGDRLEQWARATVAAARRRWPGQ
jgi:hypothetical protein